MTFCQGSKMRKKPTPNIPVREIWLLLSFDGLVFVLLINNFEWIVFLFQYSRACISWFLLGSACCWHFWRNMDLVPWDIIFSYLHWWLSGQRWCKDFLKCRTIKFTLDWKGSEFILKFSRILAVHLWVVFGQNFFFCLFWPLGSGTGMVKVADWKKNINPTTRIELGHFNNKWVWIQW